MNYKKISLYTIIIAVTNTNNLYAETWISKSLHLGSILVNALGVGIIKASVVITAIRIIGEFINGSKNSDRIFQILRDCLAIILVIYFIPRIPVLLRILMSN